MDHSIFVTALRINGPIVSILVDDIEVMGVKGLGYIKRVKSELATTFEIADMGPISFYLGLKVKKN